MNQASPRVVVSNTGPLISALQSDCMHILLQLYDQIHEIQEYRKHGADQEIGTLIESGFIVVHQDFALEENEAAKVIASEIADHHLTRDKNPEHHLPEAFAIGQKLTALAISTPSPSPPPSPQPSRSPLCQTSLAAR